MRVIQIIILIILSHSCSEKIVKEQVYIEKEYYSSETDLKDYTVEKNKMHGPIIGMLIGSTSRSYYKDYDFSKKIIKIETIKTVNKYYDLFTNKSNAGYNLSQSRDLILTFIDSSYRRKTFFVDTVMYDNEVLIYPSNYNNCSTMDKTEWNNLIKKGEIVANKNYHISDLITAKKVLKIIKESNLTILKNGVMDNLWEIYEGKFYVQISKIGKSEPKDFSEETILSNIKKVYPNDHYTFGSSNRYQMCGSYDGHDCVEEYTIEINCNREFYDKFNLYSPKSYFDNFYASFLALGDSLDLQKINEIIKNKKIANTNYN